MYNFTLFLNTMCKDGLYWMLCNNVIAFYWHSDYVHLSLQDSENIYGELFQLVSQDLATLFKKTYQLQKVST